MAMTDEEPGPRANNCHDAARGADQFRRRDNLYYRQCDHAGGRTDSGNQIRGGKSNGTDGSFKWRPKDIKRKQIKGEMSPAVVKKQGSEQSPEFPFANHFVVIERTEPAHHDGIIQSASAQFEIENDEIDENEKKHDRRFFQPPVELGLPRN